jgi:regulator of protease activity HflC (stomatin/prohibitin superfamily)
MFKLIGGGILALVVIIFIFKTVEIVDQTERGVLLRFGQIERVLEPGLNFVNPFTENVQRMDVSVKAVEINELSYSKDSQVVTVSAVINYQVNPVEVESVYEEVRRDIEVRYVLPRAKDALKNSIAKYTAQGLIENRSVLTSEFKTALQEQLADSGVSVHSVSLTNFDFDDAYETAVQNKQVQEQQALAQVNITKQEEEKKKQEILKAEALAEKTLLEAAALASQNGEKVVAKIYSEAALKAAEKWNGVGPQTIVTGSESGQIPLFPYLGIGK